MTQVTITPEQFQLGNGILKQNVGIWEPHCSVDSFVQGLKEQPGGLDSLTQEQLQKVLLYKREIERRARTCPVWFYEPYESRLYKGRKPQEMFHRSLTKIRLLCGGNRAGKTQSGAVEAVWFAEGTHPFRKVRVPNHGWVISLDYRTSTDVAEEKMRRYLSPYMIKHWDKVERIVTLHNGSTIGFRSCDQDIQKFGGVARDWLWFDEEPPGQRGYAIYQECLMRTADRAGVMWFTLTPVSGMSWTYEEFFEMAGVDKDIFVIEIQSWENPYIPEEELKRIETKLSEDEKDMRLKGKYIQFSGLVYKEFKKEVHVIPPFELPEGQYAKFRTIDHGLNNPTACLWVATDKDGNYYVYDEYYETNKLVEDNAKNIIQITGGDRIRWTTIDPSTDNRDPISGSSVRKQYLQAGLATKALRTEKDAGINAVRRLLQPNPVNGRPKLFIFDHCVNTIKEISRYRWKMYRGKDDVNKPEETQKVLDHCVTGDTLIDTTEGSVQIKDLVGKTGKVYCYDLEKKTKTISEYKDVRMTRQEADVYEVLFEDGRTVKATKEHFFLTLSGWKELGSLTNNDEIIDIMTTT